MKINELEASVHEAFDKARWNWRSQDEAKAHGKSEEKVLEERVNEMTILNSQTKKIDMTKMRITDLPTCPEVILPEPRPNDQESQLEAFKTEVMNITKEYIKEKCDDKGNLKEKNLSKQETKGLKQLKERIKNGDKVVCSDKSGKLCLLTEEEYIASARPHIEKDKILSSEEVARKEDMLNCHTFQFARVIGLCKKRWKDKRLKSAVTNTNIKPPPVYCLIKDHKTIVPGEPIPSRNVCGAVSSQTAQLGHMATMIMNGAADLIAQSTTSECDSTEDMIASMEQTNQKIKNLKIEDANPFSTDVKALYPSITKKEGGNIVKKMMVESEITVEGFDWKEAALYLTLTLADDEPELIQLKEDMAEVMPKRKKTGGARPGITTAEVRRPFSATDHKTSRFTFGTREPNEQEKRRLMAECMRVAVITMMENHAYSFKGETHLQEEGGSIGERFTQALARLVMLDWDRKFLQLASENNIEVIMYKRYIDDVNGVSRALEPGMRWNPEAKKMELAEDQVLDDMQVPADARTVQEIVKMGSSISEMIQLTGECPSGSPGEKMPVLDLSVWMDKDADGDRTVWWQHYRKPVTNTLLMMEKSAMPAKVKRTTLTQEVIRILRNCRLELPWEEKAAMLTEMSTRMKMSGYCEKFREEVIASGVNGFEKMVQVQEAGGRPVNRPRSWEQETRRKKKTEKSITWHKNGGFDVPLFIPCTPGGELAKKIKGVEEKKSGNRTVRFKVIETGGIAMKSLLQKSDPWAGGKCGRQGCFPCKGEKSGGDCERNSVTYRIVCKTCEENNQVAHYIGETSRNMYSRGKEHLQQYSSRSKASALWAHCVKFHDSAPATFIMQLTGVFSSSLRRQIAEGVQIRNFVGIIMNRKSEYRMPAVARTVYIRHVDNE